MPPKCKVRKTWPAIGPKGCKAKPEEPLGSKAAPASPAAKAAPAQAPVSDVQRLRHKTYRVALEIKAKRKALEQSDRVIEGLKKTNAAATRANIIRRIKAARGRKHMAVH